MAASSAVTFAIDETGKIANIIANADEIVRDRYEGLAAEYKDARGKNFANAAEIDDLRNERDGLNVRISATKHEEERSGLRTGSHRNVTLDDGTVQTEFVPSPEMSRWEKQLAEVNARIKFLGDQNFPTEFGRVNGALQELQANTKLAAEDLPELSPSKGSPDADYKAAFAKARQIECDLEELWKRPRTVAEMREGIIAHVAALAARGKAAARRGGRRRRAHTRYPQAMACRRCARPARQ